MSQLQQRLIRCATDALGGIGENYIRRQCEVCGFKLEEVTPEQLPTLAKTAYENSRLLVGRMRAEALQRNIQLLAQSDSLFICPSSRKETE